MIAYIGKRCLLAVVTIFAVVTITFFAMHAVPGGPFNTERTTSADVKAEMEKRYNLDKPIGVQYVSYLGSLLKGDFGVSIKTGRSINKTIGDTFLISAKIGGMGILLAIILGILFGTIAAMNQNRLADRLIMFLSTFFVSVPNFVIASLLLLVFCLILQWVPVWTADGNQYLLPVIAVAMYPMSCIIRYMRTSMLEVLSMDYIRTARAKGISNGKVIFKHALRNAVIPVITYVGPMIAYVLTGSIVVETVFTIGGLGGEFVNAITNRDYSMIMGTTVFFSFIIVTVMLISDICYRIVDPRIQL